MTLNRSSYLSLRAGFTMMETLLTVAVLAIVLSMAFPSFVEMFKIQKERGEEMDLTKVRDALEAYARANTTLPVAGGATPDQWAQDLSKYTDLSPQEVLTDHWGRKRTYRMYSTTENYRGTQLTMYYGAVASLGPDGLYASGTDVSVPAAWFPGSAVETEFASLTPSNDDQIAKYSDRPLKLANYDLTLERMDKISKALEGYAQTKLAEAVVVYGDAEAAAVTACSGSDDLDGCMATQMSSYTKPEQKVYYPRTSLDAASALYDATVNTEMHTYFSDDTVYAGATDATRKTDMVALVRFLGLPDDTCCAAPYSAAASGTAFYYSSNPRPRDSAGSCLARPAALTTAKLPARLVQATVNPVTGQDACL